MWNWSRWCWLGAWPHPLPTQVCASAERHYQPPASDDDKPATRVNTERALVVDGVYKSLPLVEQRILQSEYPRRYEFDEFDYRGNLLRNVRETAVPKRLGIKKLYYRLALNNALRLVMEAFH